MTNIARLFSYRYRAEYWVYALLLIYPLLPWPRDAGGLFSAVPLGAGTTCALVITGVLFAVLPRGSLSPRLGSCLLSALTLFCVIKTAVRPGLVERGLLARYYANESWSGSYERSTEHRGPSATRIDHRLDFDAGHFPLYFFNDVKRFNFYQAFEPRRQGLPFSATWEGYLLVTEGEAGPQRLFLDSANPAEVELDGHVVLDVVSGRTGGSVSLSPGMHALHVRYRNPYLAPRRLVAGTLREEVRRPFAGDRVFLHPYSPAQLHQAETARRIGLGLDLLYLLVLLSVPAVFLLARPRAPSAGALRLRPPLAALVLCALPFGLWRAQGFAGRLDILSGGDDWLTYESCARDIVLNGPLMLQGSPPGHALPFYAQPLYAYHLALVHLVFGEDLWGIMLVQHLTPALVGILLFFTGREVFGPREGWLTLGLWLVSLPLGTRYLITARFLLSENLAFVLFPLSALLLIRFFRRPGAALALLSGAAFGLTVLSRSVTLPAYPLLLGLGAFSGKGDREGLGRRMAALLSLMTLSAALVVSLAPLRNQVAAGRAVLLPASGAPTLLVGNTPPRSVDLSKIDTDPTYEALGLARETRMVLEYASQEPGTFALGLLTKLLFSLGFYLVVDPRASIFSISPVFIGLWVCLGVYLRARIVRHRQIEVPEAVLLVFIAVQLFALVLYVPHVYSFSARMVQPMYLALYPFGGYTICRLLRRCDGASASGRFRGKVG